MKKLLLIFIFLPLLSIAQSIDVKIKGTIEFEGHLYKNESLEFPYMFKANTFDSTVYKGNIQFVRTKCNNKECETIHLSDKNSIKLISSSNSKGYLIAN